MNEIAKLVTSSFVCATKFKKVENTKSSSAVDQCRGRSVKAIPERQESRHFGDEHRAYEGQLHLPTFINTTSRGAAVDAVQWRAVANSLLELLSFDRCSGHKGITTRIAHGLFRFSAMRRAGVKTVLSTEHENMYNVFGDNAKSTEIFSQRIVVSGAGMVECSIVS
ncbi:hypothetical protein GCK32_011286 [Trichostrongylus colubriformis]|uniref:Uncharacterized protein n=1 Tax=Trichostrongylus colubriformis TaxID=6319 RepID=A0AAN8FHQ3_TRICO